MAGTGEASQVNVNGTRARDEAVPESIAIVGMGCRLPADVKSPSELWQMLQENRSSQCETPSSRWNIDGFYHSDPDYPGTLHHRGGYFIKEDVRAFDNSFFGINNLEAISMDPQQRNLLEVVYECLESAGAKIEEISGRNIGCYVGSFTTDFINISTKDPDSITRYGATGIGTTILSDRISHIFNLAGPTFVIDTACSSSLYALHNACLALQSNEIEAALVCGTNLLMSPEQQIATVKAGVLSPTSTCHSFDESADGYGRADGIGALYVKRLSDAIKDRDPIRSIVRGTALNCNGRTFGITLPSIEGQEAVIRKAYSKAGIALGETDYVECHGTGTRVGDPIEVEALSRVFGSERKEPLLLGSVKSNVGHSEAASGITSIIKATLMLENALIPPTHGLKKINSNIQTSEWNVRIVTQNEPWPQTPVGMPRRVSINSFGYGGANAHAVLEHFDHSEARVSGSQASDLNDCWTYLLPFSAKSKDGLLRRVRTLAKWNNQSQKLKDLAYTLGCRRSVFLIRGFLTAQQCSLDKDLGENNLIHIQESVDPTPLPIAMIFTGQGAQWPRMSLELLEQHATFRSAIRALDEDLRCLREAPAWTIEQTIKESAAESSISDPWRSQPVCTAVQIALVDLFRTWNIFAHVVVGHSSGEIAAAYAAGHITSTEAIAIAYYRGLVIARGASRGAMMVIGLGEQDADAEIDSAGLRDNLRVGCKNSQQISTLSGREEAIHHLYERLTSRKIFAKKLRTNGVAYHSYDMANIGAAYEDFLSLYLDAHNRIPPGAPTHRMVSTVTGKYVEAAQTRQPGYWRANLESPVEFANAISTAVEDQQHQFIEIGPHSALELPLKQIVSQESRGAPFRYVSAIVRNTNSRNSSLSAIGQLFLYGHEIDFGRVNAIPNENGTISHIPIGNVLKDLPEYPWQHNTILWNESRTSTEYRFRKHSRHDLLGSIVPGGSPRSSTWRNLLRLKEVPWLEDHQLEGSIVFPAAGYMAMAIEAYSRISEAFPTFSTVILRSVHFLNTLILPSDTTKQVELITDLRPWRNSRRMDSKTWCYFEVSSIDDRGVTLHASGLVGINHGEISAFDASTSGCEVALTSVNPTRWYEQLAARGLEYGPHFQPIRAMSFPRDSLRRYLKSDIQAFCGTADKQLHQEPQYLLHPTVIDALLQTGLMADSCGDLVRLRAGIPVSIETFSLQVQSAKRLGEQLTVQATASQAGPSVLLLECELSDGEKNLLASMNGVRVAEYVAADTQLSHPTPIFELVWKPDIDYLDRSSYRAFLDYIEGNANRIASKGTEHSFKYLIGILDLIMHKRPDCRVLELEASSSSQDKFGKAIRAIANYETSYQRCETIGRGQLAADGSITVSNGLSRTDHEVHEHNSYHGKFDVVVCRKSHGIDLWLANAQSQLSSILNDNAWILCYGGHCETQFPASSFDVISASLGLQQPLTVARLNKGITVTAKLPSDQVILVMPNERSKIVSEVSQSLAVDAPFPVIETKLEDISPETIQSGAIIVAMIEAEVSVLSNLNRTDMQAIKMMSQRAGMLLWMTGGDLLRRRRPDMAVVHGFCRAMRLEHYPVKFGILDVDYPETSAEVVGRSISDVLIALQTQRRGDDEFILRSGLLHVSRMTPHQCLNSSMAVMRSRTPITIPRKHLGPAQLTIRRPGEINTIYMEQQKRFLDHIQDNEVEIDVLAIGLNAKDLYSLMGRVDTKDSTTSLECTGTVHIVGKGVSDFVSGDRVIVMAPQKFSSTIRVPVWCCCKLLAHESYLEMATIPLVLSTAIYALRHRAQLKANESVLIHSATGGLGQAAIQVAKMIGAKLFVTAGTEKKRKYLNEELGVARNCIFSSRDSSFEADIQRETAGRGVDVILNSLSGDLLHAGWRCTSEFGRFVEVGKKDITEAGSLDMSVFGRAASFSAFDLSDLYYSKGREQNTIWSSLLNESVRLVREGTCRLIKPLEVFDVSETKQAFRFFGSQDRLGKVVIDLGSTDQASTLEVLTDRYKTSFSSQKTYLLVGCLGGIGRHLSRWMVSRGARNLIFIGRSGIENPAAKSVVQDLIRAGANVKVIRGDISNAEVTTSAVRAADTSIGGVIQAAMALKESLFTEMSVSEWHQVLAPKVKGTWNLHHSLRGCDSELDFFITTGSITGTIGQATESNYSAANSFLDAFAHHRRGLGLPAASVALGAIKGVGYLAEHPETDSMIQRQGFKAIDEEELLLLLDLAISGCQDKPGQHKLHDHACIVTGLDERSRIQRVMEDPRAGILASAVSRMSVGSDTATDTKNSRLPRAIQDALSTSDGKALYAAVENVVATKLAALVQTPAEQVTAQTQLVELGMDSMLAVETRQGATLGVDVPLVDLMASRSTVGDIARKVAEGLLKSFK